MAKLYFRHGTVCSAKTLNLLAVAHSYRQQGKAVVLIKPELDTRFGRETIRSRAGVAMTADILVSEETRLLERDWDGVDCILVDEAQFLPSFVIEDLRTLTLHHPIPVICYGLRTDFRRHLFEGSRRLLELADSIEEVKTTCFNCNKKSIYNLKFVNGKAVKEGPSIELGAEEKYLPACASCWEAKVAEGLL